MKIQNTVLVIALFSLLVIATGAQDEGFKVGIVDLEQVISSTTEGKAAREEMARKQREAEESLAPLYERYKGLEDDLKAKKFVLSDDALLDRHGLR